MTAGSAWVLVHSPLLAPSSWRPTADVLRSRGVRVAVPDLRPALRERSALVSALARTVADAAGAEGRLVLVGHSGAGPVLPAVASAVHDGGGQVTASVLVDAGMPHPGRSPREVLPPAVAEQLEALRTGDRILPWAQWWPEEVLADLLPDPDARRELVEDGPVLPVELFDEPMPEVDEAQLGRCAYLRLSEAYDSALADATGRGWVTRSLAADHLASISRPEDVAGALEDLVTG